MTVGCHCCEQPVSPARTLPSRSGTAIAALALAPFVRGSMVVQVQRRVDQRQMRESLGEIAKVAARPGIVLLGQQPDIIAQANQSLEQGARFVTSALQYEVVDEPE